MSFAMAVYSYAAQVPLDQPRIPDQLTEGFVVEERSPAQVFALVIGLTLVAAGIAGFFYNASFDTGDDLSRDAVIGILDVNGWHNVVHIVTGVIGLALAGSYDSARLFALAAGAVYIVVAVAGFIAGDGGELVGLIPVNTEDNFLHLLIGIAGLGAGLATPAVQPPSVATA
jgi:Na+-transporting methylmalonyl-CoA/oxaloacetate decarboxylase beta subunit